MYAEEMESKRQKWHITYNGRPIILRDVSVRLKRLTPEEIRMYTRSSKKRAAETLQEQGTRAREAPSTSKRFKRIVLPCDNSDEDDNSKLENANKLSSGRSVLSVGSEGVKHELTKGIKSGKSTSSEPNQQSNKISIVGGKNTKEGDLNKVFVASNSSSGKVGDCDSAAKTLAKNQPNKVFEIKLFEPGTTVRKVNPKFSEDCEDKGESVKKRKVETNCIQVIVFPPKVPDRTTVECRTLTTKQHLKTFINQPSQLVSANNKEDTKKLSSKPPVSSSHENKFNEPNQKIFRVDDKSKDPLHNEKIKHLPKLTDKSPSLCKVNEKYQQEGASSFVSEPELKEKCTSPISGIVAENIYELINVYEQLTTPPGNVKSTTEKRNDKKPSQKKMLNMFGEEHLIEDSPFISSLSNKEKLTFPSVIRSTFNHIDSVKVQDSQENVTKLKSFKANHEKYVTNAKDLSNIKVKDVKKRKLSEPLNKQKTEKSRRHSTDQSVERPNRPTNMVPLAKKDLTGCEKRPQISFQKKTLTGLAVGSSGSKNSNGDKIIHAHSQICLSSCAIDKTKRSLDVANENTEGEQAKKIKNTKESGSTIEKYKSLENDGKKTKSGIGANDVASRKKEMEKIENKKRRTSVGGSSSRSISPKNKCQVVSSKLEKTNVTSDEKTKLITSEVDRLKEISGVCSKAKENLNKVGEASSSEKENMDRPEKIQAEIIHFSHATSKGITETSPSTINNSFNNCSIERSSQVKNLSSAIRPLKITTDTPNTPNKSNDNLRRSSKETYLKGKEIDKQSSSLADKLRPDDALMSEEASQLRLEDKNLKKVVREPGAKQPVERIESSVGGKSKADDASKNEEISQLELELELEKIVGEVSAKHQNESPVGSKPGIEDVGPTNRELKQLELEKRVCDTSAKQQNESPVGSKPGIEDVGPTNGELKQLELEKRVGDTRAKQQNESPVSGKSGIEDGGPTNGELKQLELAEDESLENIVGRSSAKQSDSSSICDLLRTDDASINEELSQLELEYERLAKIVGETCAKKYMLWRRIEVLQGIQVIKQEVPDDDDDDCQIIVPCDANLAVKEENNSSIATEVVDWLDDSASEQQCEALEDCDIIIIDDSPTVGVEDSVSVAWKENDVVLARHNISRLGSSSEIDTQPNESDNDLDSCNINKVVDNSVINRDDSANRKQKIVERLGTHSTSTLASSSVIEVSSVVSQINSEEVVNGSNVDKVDSCPTMTVQDSSCVQQKSVLVLRGHNTSGIVCHSVVDYSEGLQQNEIRKTGNANDANSLNSCLVPVNYTSNALQGRNVETVDGCSRGTVDNSFTLVVEGKSATERLSGSSELVRSEGRKISTAADEPVLNNPELSESGNTVAVREERIRVRGIEDLLARPFNVVATLSQGRVPGNLTQSDDGFLKDCFRDQEGISYFKELVNVMVLLGKEAERYISSNTCDKSNLNSRTIMLQSLISYHCILIYKLCKKVIESYKESPDCFLSIMFMQMVSKWQGYMGKFTVHHLKVLLKSSFHGFLRKVHPDCHLATEREALDLLIKMKVFHMHPKQVQPLVAGSPEPSSSADSNRNAIHIVPNNNPSNSQLQSVSSTVNSIINVRQENRVAAPNAVCHAITEKNIPAMNEQNSSELGSRNTNVGQLTLQSEISSTSGPLKPVKPHYPQSYVHPEYVNTRTHAADNNQNASDLSAKTAPFYRPPPDYYAVRNTQSNVCQQPSQPILTGQVMQNQGVLVGQQNTSNLQRLIEMSINVKMRNGSNSASHPAYNMQNPHILQQLQKPVLNTKQTTLPKINNSQEVVNGQYLANYQLQQNQRLPFHTPVQESNSTSRLNPESERPSAHAPSFQGVSSNLQQFHSNQRHSLGNPAVQDTHSTPQYHPSQKISLSTSSLQASKSMYQQSPSSLQASKSMYQQSPSSLQASKSMYQQSPSSLQASTSLYQQRPQSQMQSHEISSLRVQQQHAPSQRLPVSAPSAKSFQFVSQTSSFDKQAQQQHAPSQRPSLNASPSTELHPVDHRIPLNTSSLRDPISMHQQNTPSLRPSFSGPSFGEPISSHPSQRPSFVAPSSREPISTLRHQPISQVQLSGSSNPFTNLKEYEKQTAHQLSGDQLYHYNKYSSNLHSTMRQVSDWQQYVGRNIEQLPTRSYNSKSRDEASLQHQRSSQGVSQLHGQEQQFLHKPSLNARPIQIGQSANDYQSHITQTAPCQSGRDNENILSRLLSPNAKSFECLKCPGNIAYQSKLEQQGIQQNGSRATIIQSAPYRDNALQIPNEYISPVLDKSYSYHQPSPQDSSQNALPSPTYYTSNLQPKTGVGTYVYNNNTMNYVGAGSCRQSSLPSLASPVHDTSPGLLPEESDQVRGQGVSRSVSRDSGYRSPSQGNDNFVRTCGKCCVCNKEAFLTCSRCKSVFYCNTGCQIGDWPRHKTGCKAPVKI